MSIAISLGAKSIGDIHPEFSWIRSHALVPVIEYLCPLVVRRDDLLHVVVRDGIGQFCNFSLELHFILIISREGSHVYSASRVEDTFARELSEARKLSLIFGPVVEDHEAVAGELVVEELALVVDPVDVDDAARALAHVLLPHAEVLLARLLHDAVAVPGAAHPGPDVETVGVHVLAPSPPGAVTMRLPLQVINNSIVIIKLR